MKVSVASITPEHDAKAIYMLCWGDSYERGSSGPYRGKGDCGAGFEKAVAALQSLTKDGAERSVR